MNCFGPPEAIVLLLGLLVACQLQVDGAGLKDAAKALAETAVKKAEETTEAPQVEGGVRSAVAHTALTMVAEKAIDAIGVKYPAVKPFAPLAKPLVGKAHNAINKMFSKKENTGEQPAADAADKPEQPEKETGGLLSKIKSAVGVGGPAKEADKAPAEPEKSADSEKPEDKKKKKPEEKKPEEKKPEEKKSEDKKPEEKKPEEKKPEEKKPEEKKPEEKKDEENKEAEKEVEEPGSKQEKSKVNKMAGGKMSAGRKG